MSRAHRIFALLVAAVILAGCASSKQRAPVVERGGAASKTTISAVAARKKALREKDWRPQVHVVQKGETLYSIAFNYGFDYHELAELNGIKDPDVIQAGQQIRLFPGAASHSIAVAETKPIEPAIKDQPKLVKYAYSEAAVAQLSKPERIDKPAAVTPAKPEKVEPKLQPKPEPKPTEESAEVEPDADIEWSLPTQGKVIAGFSEAANRKGVDIAGKQGQPVNASAPGKVVYSGSGLRGYGKLVIIKHNNTFLSAYAHNDKVLVKEGQSVTRGQKIAEMGNTDADQVKLHFEVRRFGKPVDPAKYLPL
ncbi:MAG: peptidoglycan DD-metalloendopeptidase family protein [Gallionella sp.]|jgi:lipoprotein NlpD|nr:peptidoglycan DD-metalloendopeptidase family protein [Gallionella sp.]MCK9355504.1 peptidoglycan DD-metalloendopeptidase family protein [Gallionella sp.]